MASKTRQVRLRPQNPFDLIRLLARSQSDPRKAVAELVQNSLDAGARHIEIVWFNDKRRRALRIWDDGQGVFPELEREEALRRIARTVGHSHKREKLAVAQMWVEGVSTRKVKQVTEQLCGLEVTSSQVSRAAQLLDEELDT